MKNAEIFEKELSRALFEHVQDGLVLLDENGELLQINVSAQELLGSPALPEPGDHIIELIPEFDITLLASAAPGNRNKPQLLRLGAEETKASIITHFNEASKTFLLFIRDLGLQEELEETKNMLNEAEEVASIGYFELDLRTKKSQRSNGVLKLLGLSPNTSESEYRDFMERSHPIDKAVEQEALKKLQSGVEQQEWERWIVRTDGEERLLRIRAKMIKDSRGVPSRVVGVNIDITEARQYSNKLLEAVLQAHEQERAKIASEIHDEFGPAISSAKNFFERIPIQTRQSFGQEFDENIKSLEELAKALRGLSHQLVPKSLIDFGLSAALESLCGKLEGASELNISLTISGNINALPKEIELNIYRIVQELTLNVVKHANAERLIIQLTGNKKSIVLVVEDDGKGIKPNVDIYDQGIGLLNIKSRVRSLFGTMRINLKREKGILIRIKIPV